MLIETKIFYHEPAFKNGKKQLAYYCKHLGLDKGIYLIFIPEHILEIQKENGIGEAVENIEGVQLYTYLVEYEDELPEYRKPKPRKSSKKV